MDAEGQQAVWSDVEAVVQETMERVRFNADLLYDTLRAKGYSFESDTPRTLPDADTAEHVEGVKEVAGEFGELPLSLEYFWRIVGAVDFRHSWKQPARFHMADPLYVDNVEHQLAYMANEGEGWAETMEENVEEGEPAYVEISPDIYHKDNVSGGMAYGVVLSEQAVADTRMVNMPYGDLYFVDYLRHCFSQGGFPNIAQENPGSEAWVNDLKAGLKPI